VTRRIASYVHGIGDAPLLGLTIGDMFDQIVARYPDQEALIVRHQGLRYTYRQLQVEVERCARGLMALGLQKGERIGIWSPNRADWTITSSPPAKSGRSW
jgi:fatty-acyl-CoA synthase